MLCLEKAVRGIISCFLRKSILNMCHAVQCHIICFVFFLLLTFILRPPLFSVGAKSIIQHLPFGFVCWFLLSRQTIKRRKFGPTHDLKGAFIKGDRFVPWRGPDQLPLSLCPCETLFRILNVL